MDIKFALPGDSSSAPASQISKDVDRREITEWLESLDNIFREPGVEGCRVLLRNLFAHARSLGIDANVLLNSPYQNTIAVTEQPLCPGDLELERKITALVRWNAMAMVIRANGQGDSLGGHLASYASEADLFEVGFNHFFRGEHQGQSHGARADLIFFQAHSAPGIYTRAFLEGRLTEEKPNNFRREVGGKGLSSYPHPWLMPNFWQFPTGSMGLGVLAAVYKASFIHYLVNRRLVPPTDRKVWAFVGDGEMDEPESLAGLALAARENLDNLIFVVNCNLQRLDGPVRGNSLIIQELERLFSGAGWNVIKLLWGFDWDPLFTADVNGVIARRLEQTVDGELQSYAAHDGAFNRDRFFNKNEELRRLASQLTDAQIDSLRRGGHDPVKIYAAFSAAVRHRKQPTVILAQTKKGFGLGRWADGRMPSHQQKKLDHDALQAFRRRFELPLSEADVEDTRFFCPSCDSPEMVYLHERRRDLGGFVPVRTSQAPRLEIPAKQLTAEFELGSGEREFSTTVALLATPCTCTTSRRQSSIAWGSTTRSLPLSIRDAISG